jgi:ParB family chromosome partitioning protein
LSALLLSPFEKNLTRAGMAKKGLGKGLSALISGPKRNKDEADGDSGSDSRPAPQPIPGAPSLAVVADGDQVQHVALARIVPSPFQPRKRFAEEHLGSLVDSIREKGVIQPLIVRKQDGSENLELIAGERRWRASQKLELNTVPVIVREASDQEVLEMALIENLQREDLNPIEEADAYSRLASEFGLKQEEIAQRVGKNRATIANAMRLLDLEPSVKSLVAQAMISPGHAKAILGVKTPEEQKLLADIVLRKKLNVRATEKLVGDHVAGRINKGEKRQSSGSSKQLDPVLRKLQDRLKQRFSTHVQLSHGTKKGKIEIEYYGNDDLDRILGLLGLPPE